MVFNCDGAACEKLLRHYANAELISESAEWLSGHRLPACCIGNPNLYMQCAEDEKSMVIGLWNFFEDEALDPVVRLDREYASAKFFGGTGRLCGDRVELDDIPPFGFCGIVLNK